MYAYMMYLPDTEPVALRTVHSNKQCINLNSNDFRGGGTARYTIHSTYFDFTQHKYSHITCSDASRGHLMDVSCGQKSNDSKFYVENIGSHNGFGRIRTAW